MQGRPAIIVSQAQSCTQRNQLFYYRYTAAKSGPVKRCPAIALDPAKIGALLDQHGESFRLRAGSCKMKGGYAIDIHGINNGASEQNRSCSFLHAMLGSQMQRRNSGYISRGNIGASFDKLQGKCFILGIKRFVQFQFVVHDFSD
ncbi:MAG: hypothetical protein ACD_39C00322G0002 [uncultured bacterium]|nr:MAG: hypothetical protein ACD_39C00322G0002 [uncultured bacterium]